LTCTSPFVGAFFCANIPKGYKNLGVSLFILCRFAMLPDRTLGRLMVGDKTFYTVERPWLDNKPYESCIPAGLYPMSRHDSPKFGPDVWEIDEVPDRSYILIHAGNKAGHVQGCIAPGLSLRQNLDGVGASRAAVESINKITEGIQKSQIIIIEEALSAQVFAHLKKQFQQESEKPKAATKSKPKKGESDAL
jgi:hypothetical protein